ncbi:putative quinol monooxygenase [Brevibacterium aurantiacum]|uniref:Antibiotic biosynthesis monooxygenase n=1 Tax=Brevibacterium aurantiacum TaxID=273384 RepID=A0A556CD56_BREAU|nr:putative quinol monooxygenase [Brevibacterium aurantiacum]TSI15363.1 antibiotic biosynthesis monooxygenase [Brevibacterium aurantiacum]
MHIVIAHYRASPETVGRVAELLPTLAESSRREPGNLSYSIARDLDDPLVFVIVEKYEKATDFEAHRDSAHFKEIGLSTIIPLLEDRQVDSFNAKST